MPNGKKNIFEAIEDEKLSPKDRLGPLIELLQSDEQINRHIRDLIIDLVNPDSLYPFYAQLKRRRPGRIGDPYIYSTEHYIGWTIEDQITKGAKVEAAVASACEEYKCNRSYAFSALRSYREWWKASIPLNTSENPRSLPLYWRPSRWQSSKKPE